MATGSIRSSQTRNLVTLNIKVDGTGTASITEGGQLASLADNGTGDYTLTFTEPYVSTPFVYPSVIGTAGTVTCSVHTDTNSTKTRLKFSADCLFNVLVIGSKDPA